MDLSKFQAYNTALTLDEINENFTSGSNSFEYVWDVDSPSLPSDGNLSVTVSGQDKAGNVYAGTDSITFTLDMTSFEVVNGEVNIVGETAGVGPQIVCINGWANSRDVWSGLSENLSKDHQVTTWDLRGHGDSGAPPPGNYGREEALKDISAVLDEVGRP